jgi:outer membrane protein assembly factor BamB
VWAWGSWLAAPTEGALWRLDEESGEELWKKKLPATPVGSPQVCDEVVVVATDSPAGEVVGFRLHDGETLWKWGRAITRLAARDSILVLAARGGTVLRLGPRNGDVRWSTRQAGTGWRDPWIGRDAVFVPVRPDSLVALSLEDGSRIWGQEVGEWPRVGGGDGLLAAATDDSLIVLLDPATGVIRARRGMGSIPAAAPVWDGRRIYVALREGAVTALSGEDLRTLWERMLEPPLVCAPHVDGDRVLQGAPGGIVHVLDTETGRAMGLYRHPERLIASPRTAGTRLAVGGDKGTLVVYGGES